MFVNPNNIEIEPVLPLDVPEYQYQPEDFGSDDLSFNPHGGEPREGELAAVATLNFI